MVDAYREGSTTEAADSVLALDAAIYQGVHRALSLIEKGLRGKSGAEPSILRAASMLHLDAALRCWAAAKDEDARSQLDLARRIVDLSAAIGGCRGRVSSPLVPRHVAHPRWSAAAS